MRKSEFQELKNNSIVELQKNLNEKQTKLRALKFDLASGKIKNISDIHKTKKDIARILTLINSK